MEGDLVTGMLLLVSFAILAFVVGNTLNLTIRQFFKVNWHPIPLFLTSLFLTVLFAWTLSSNLHLATMAPFHSIWVSTNLVPIFLGFNAGLAGSISPSRFRCRSMVISTLLIAAFFYVVIPIARPILAPIKSEQSTLWKDGICLQSHESTCAPAAAASLLRMSGINADEPTLIKTCYTSEYGTEQHALIRGLQLYANDREKTVKVASSNPEQWADKNQFPNIAFVNFAENDMIGNWLNRPSEGHAVVICGHENGEWIVGDPAIGKTRWSDAQFKQHFTGRAIYLANVP